MATLSDNIKFFRKQKKLTQKELADKLKVAPTAISAWEVGRNKPLMDKVEQMSLIFEISISRLLGDETYSLNDESKSFLSDSPPILQSITETSSKLEEVRQTKVLKYAKNQLDEQNSSISNVVELFEYDYYDQPASAGTGQYLNDVNKETVELTVNIDADFVIPIYGDSMEPEYHSGDYAFIKSTVNLDDGQVGVFDLKGDAYIKQLIIDGNKAFLHSFNEEYKDIPIDEFSDFRIIGKVVGSYSEK